MPAIARDSEWAGIEFTLPNNPNTEHCKGTGCSSENETEVKVIEMDPVETPPLILLFPDLRDELTDQKLLLRSSSSSTESASSLIQFLRGKQPNTALFKQSQKLPKMVSYFNTVT